MRIVFYHADDLQGLRFLESKNLIECTENNHPTLKSVVASFFSRLLFWGILIDRAGKSEWGGERVGKT